MMQSTIYFKCPGCGETALVQQIQGKYLCAKCSFDFTKLKDDSAKLDEVLIDNMKQGPMGQLMSITMHRWITLMPHDASLNYVKELASKNGIEWAGNKKGCFLTLFEKIFLRKKY